jgi:hypothetical protein
MSKRGNGYLRKMLIHGARAALPSLAKTETLLGEWLRGLLARAPKNTVVVALAAKLARIVWAVLKQDGLRSAICASRPITIGSAISVQRSGNGL